MADFNIHRAEGLVEIKGMVTAVALFAHIRQKTVCRPGERGASIRGAGVDEGGGCHGRPRPFALARSRFEPGCQFVLLHRLHKRFPPLAGQNKIRHRIKIGSILKIEPIRRVRFSSQPRESIRRQHKFVIDTDVLFL